MVKIGILGFCSMTNPMKDSARPKNDSKCNKMAAKFKMAAKIDIFLVSTL